MSELEQAAEHLRAAEAALLSYRRGGQIMQQVIYVDLTIGQVRTAQDLLVRALG